MSLFVALRGDSRKLLFYLLLLFLRARKSDNHCCRNSWKSNSYMKNIATILLLQSENLIGRQIILDYGCTNDIFADCISPDNKIDSAEESEREREREPNDRNFLCYLTSMLINHTL